MAPIFWWIPIIGNAHHRFSKKEALYGLSQQSHPDRQAMKVTIEIEQLGDVVTLIEALDRHKVGALLVALFLMLVVVAALGCYWVLTH